MRSDGAPPGSAVASAMASGTGTAERASSNHCRNCCTGAASRSCRPSSDTERSCPEVRYGPRMHAFDVRSVVEKLRSSGGGYEIVHESVGLELGVYVLVAPEPDRQQPHEDDEVYVVIEGDGVLDVE